MSVSVTEDHFPFPPLGATGEGEPVYPPGMSRANFRTGERPVYWQRGPYFVAYQLDRPACAFRCHYPGGSAPCNRETAQEFIRWAEDRYVLDLLREVNGDAWAIAEHFVDEDVSRDEYEGCSSELEMAFTEYEARIERVKKASGEWA